MKWKMKMVRELLEMVNCLEVLENTILKQCNAKVQKWNPELNVEINNPISDYKDRYLVIGQKGGKYKHKYQ